MRFALCSLLLLGCGLTGSEHDVAPTDFDSGETPESDEVSTCEHRDYRIDVVLTEATCESEAELSQSISCTFDGCESRAFSCELFDGTLAHNDGITGPWVIVQSPGGVDCTITYEVSFPSF